MHISDEKPKKKSKIWFWIVATISVLIGAVIGVKILSTNEEHVAPTIDTTATVKNETKHEASIEEQEVIVEEEQTVEAEVLRSDYEKVLGLDSTTQDIGYATADLNSILSDAELSLAREDEIDLLVSHYLDYFAQAVNRGDFELVRPYLYPGSELYNTQQVNIVNMHDVGIREQLLEYNITSIQYDETTQTGSLIVYEKYLIEKQNPEYSIKELDYINTYDFIYNTEQQCYQLTTIYL